MLHPKDTKRTRHPMTCMPGVHVLILPSSWNPMCMTWTKTLMGKFHALGRARTTHAVACDQEREPGVVLACPCQSLGCVAVHKGGRPHEALMHAASSAQQLHLHGRPSDIREHIPYLQGPSAQARQHVAGIVMRSCTV